MLIPALSHSAEALGEFGTFDLTITTHQSVLVGFHLPMQGKQQQESLQVLQPSHVVSHRMVAPWGWGPLRGMGTACSSLQLPCACHGVTDYF